MALILYIFNKQYITVDNTHQLLYTVYHKGEKKNMHIILNHSSMVPIYEQLMEQIKSEIIQSVLKEGEALPSVRTLAGELRISALTVNCPKSGTTCALWLLLSAPSWYYIWLAWPMT